MEWLAQIDTETTLLTPNRRLSAALLNQFNQLKIQQNYTCWESLDILPLPSWLQRIWHAYTAKQIATTTPLLLTAQQEKILWLDILRKSPENAALLQINATAELAKAAWDLLKLWQVPLDNPALATTEDGQAFQRWAQQLQKIYQKNNWLATQSLPDLIQEKLLAQQILPPKKIILIGFTEIAPQHKNLFHICEQLGSEIIYLHPKPTTVSLKKIGLSDEESEIRTMANWAKTLFNAQTHKKPLSIGCVIPRLEALRSSVLQIFAETFSAENTFTQDQNLLPFNISAGKNLIAFPIIHTALELLSLPVKPLSITTLSQLLRSPFLIASEHEQTRRAALDNRLRNANIATLTLAQLIKPNATYDLGTACPALQKSIKRFLAYFSALPSVLPLHEWAIHFTELLTLLGWPGERSLNSEEYQIVQRWLVLLTEYNSFSQILPAQKFTQALEYLVQLAAHTVFQAQTPLAPIQILGTLEAAELPFEHVWIMGFDDTNWPAAPKPNPFIPAKLQKMLQMPHASTERELAYCSQLMHQLTQNSTHAIFSYPLKNAEIELRPSALLNTLAEITLAELHLQPTQTPQQKIFQTRALTSRVDNMAPPTSAEEIIRGGAAIFKQQAACPFKAFAELRLYARQFEAPTLGLRSIERGNIVHKALELIWQTIKDSHTLLTLSAIELQHIVQQAALAALEATLSTENIASRYLKLELIRLEKILLQWLQIEAERPPFKVLYQEHEINATVGNIPVHVRIDRMDTLADGQCLIIDYKTGKNNAIKYWFGARPEEPQLPLYCILTAEKTAGIAFAELHPDKLSLTGISKTDLAISSIKSLPDVIYTTATTWDAQLSAWKMTLENLSHDFARGHASVDPKDPNQTCAHCKLHTFCRIHEQL